MLWSRTLDLNIDVVYSDRAPTIAWGTEERGWYCSASRHPKHESSLHLLCSMCGSCKLLLQELLSPAVRHSLEKLPAVANVLEYTLVRDPAQRPSAQDILHRSVISASS